ncbi:Arginase, catabolizes arginine to ornithine and urea [Blyttiomyces sp. JEL0837]|nr:Arginase, catabolizes arginine to ornithine and urea [Blyttiomyces sp. JEL0837]
MSVNDIVNDHVEQRFLKLPLTVGIIGAGFNGGQPKGGVEKGPAELVKYGLLDQIKELGWKIENEDTEFPCYEHLRKAAAVNGGSVSEKPSKIKNAGYVSRVCRSVSEMVQKTVSQGHLALTLGGDHSLAMGTISGSAAVHKNVGVIWVDAHADINTPESTTSGNLHGCPVSFLTGLAGHVEGFEWLTPCLKTNRIVYIGLRDLDPPEKKMLRESKIKAFSMHEVDRWGIGKVVDMAIQYLGGRHCPIHLTFDVDAMDPSEAPATGTPVRGGLSFREGHYIMETCYQTGSLVAVDLMEVNPHLGDDVAREQTLKIGCSLIRSAMGEYTASKAASLNLKGWVRNNDDDEGSVEGLAIGKPEEIKAFTIWVSTIGSPKSKITRCDCTAPLSPEELQEAWKAFKGFEIRR